MKTERDLRKYVGRSYEEYSCFDLVKEFYKDFFNLDVKNYYEGSVPDRKEVASLINTNRGDFALVDGPKKFGDLVLIKLHGLECHIGVLIEGSHFLHSIKTTGSCMDRLDRYQKMIAGYYRHKETST